jgi:hypothetical protein
MTPLPIDIRTSFGPITPSKDLWSVISAMASQVRETAEQRKEGAGCDIVPLKEQRIPGIGNIAFIRWFRCRSFPVPEYIYWIRKLAKVDGRIDARITRFVLTAGELP